MAKGEPWVTGIVAIERDGDTFRIVLASGADRLCFRLSRHMLQLGVGMAGQVLAERPVAEVVALRGH